MKTIDVSDVKELLRGRGVKPTVHRIEILRYIMSTRIHPTADEVYEYFRKEERLPVLSRATVYNTLKALAEAGLVTVIITPDAVRYDYVTKGHHHFYCHACRKVYDVELNVELPRIEKINGHVVQHAQLTMVGVCQVCSGKNVD